MQLLQCTASLPSGSRQCNSCNALPHCLGAVGSATPAVHSKKKCFSNALGYTLVVLEML